MGRPVGRPPPRPPDGRPRRSSGRPDEPRRCRVRRDRARPVRCRRLGACAAIGGPIVTVAAGRAPGPDADARPGRGPDPRRAGPGARRAGASSLAGCRRRRSGRAEGPIPDRRATRRLPGHPARRTPTSGFIVVYELARPDRGGRRPRAEQAAYLASGPGPGPVPARRAPRHPAGRLDGRPLLVDPGRGRRTRSTPEIQAALETLGTGRPGPVLTRTLDARQRSRRRDAAGRRSSAAQRADRVALDLERVGPREVLARPEPPAGDPLVRAEGRVGRLDRGVDARRRIAAGSSPSGRPATTASIRPGVVSTTTASRSAGDPERVLDVLGVHVEAVRQHDDVLDPAAQDRAGPRRRSGRCRRSGTSRPR